MLERFMKLKNGFRSRKLTYANSYEYLKTMKPTSVKSERGFSAIGNFVIKLRSSLEDDTLNAICF
jgi:hypothetical protein